MKGILYYIILGVIAVVFWGCIAISAKRDEKKKKEYREQNVSEVLIQDKFFGEVACEYDKEMNQLTFTNLSIPFGKYNPRIYIEDYEEDKREFYFRKLEYVYQLQQEIIEKMIAGFLETYTNCEELTRERLEETFSIETISLEKCNEFHSEYLFAEDTFIEGDHFECEVGDWLLIVESEVDKKKIFRNNYAVDPVVYLKCETNEMCYMLAE